MPPYKAQWWLTYKYDIIFDATFYLKKKNKSTTSFPIEQSKIKSSQIKGS